jgi:hypothetical protein
MLARDKRTCRALGKQFLLGGMTEVTVLVIFSGDHPKLWLSNRVMIREIDLVTKQPKALLRGLDSAVAMDYSIKRNLVFWSDVAKEIIYK